MKSTENTNRNLITALYCRLSQEDERLGESLSIENQRLMLQRYAEEHRFPNIQFYVDDGFSGADFNRPSSTDDERCGMRPRWELSLSKTNPGSAEIICKQEC